jgi:hypothetical protein
VHIALDAMGRGYSFIPIKGPLGRNGLVRKYTACCQMILKPKPLKKNRLIYSISSRDEVTPSADPALRLTLALLRM